MGGIFSMPSKVCNAADAVNNAAHDTTSTFVKRAGQIADAASYATATFAERAGQIADEMSDAKFIFAKRSGQVADAASYATATFAERSGRIADAASYATATFAERSGQIADAASKVTDAMVCLCNVVTWAILHYCIVTLGRDRSDTVYYGHIWSALWSASFITMLLFWHRCTVLNRNGP
jgi:hypothetical protein